jgi:hypothetical protein
MKASINLKLKLKQRGKGNMDTFQSHRGAEKKNRKRKKLLELVE